MLVAFRLSVSLSGGQRGTGQDTVSAAADFAQLSCFDADIVISQLGSHAKKQLSRLSFSWVV